MLFHFFYKMSEKNIASFFLKRAQELPNNGHIDSEQSEEEELEEPQSDLQPDESQVQPEVMVCIIM
jgi:hypothetical protein